MSAEMAFGGALPVCRPVPKACVQRLEQRHLQTSARRHTDVRNAAAERSNTVNTALASSRT